MGASRDAGPGPAFELYFPECGVHHDGAALHQQVPPSHWCVARADLERFREGVRQLLAQGLVQSTPQDPFEATDDLVGPNFYTVNAQVIKPVTAKAGNPSWALMLHPEGLKCELFVTHGWTEGIFEFLDKLFNSWPAQARNVYCCMLSNPQNLDIGALIDSPKDSPFTHALRASQCVLVVPNREASIYSRIWCIYEAFLACEESKVILTAVAPVPGVRRHTLCVFLLLFVALNATWMTCEALAEQTQSRPDIRKWLLGYELTILQSVPYLLLPVSSFIVPGLCALVLICLSAAFSGINLGLQCVILSELGPEFFELTPYSMAADIFLLAGTSVASILAEAVRLRRLQSSREAGQLLKGYTGRLWDAESSVAEDKQRIMAELCFSVQEVEEAIQVLLDHGMSTPTLRDAALRAGRLRHAGYVSASTLVLAVCSWLYLPLRHIATLVDEHQRAIADGVCDSSNCAVNANVDVSMDMKVNNISELCANCTLPVVRPAVWTSALGVVEVVTWVLIFWALPKDKRGFALQAVARIGVFMGGLLIIAMQLAEERPAGENPWANGIVQLGLAPLGLFLSAAGPGLAARTPVIGPWLVRQVMRPLSIPRPCQYRQVAHQRSPEPRPRSRAGMLV